MGDESRPGLDWSGMDPESQAAFAMWVTGVAVLAVPLVVLRLIVRRWLRRVYDQSRG